MYPNSNLIPLVIHQFVSDRDKVPPLQEKCMRQWEDFAEKHEFEYYLWTPLSIKKLIEREGRQDWAELIANCRNYGEYGDIVRFIVLSVFGGWWVDWDISIIHPEKLAVFLNQLHCKATVTEEDYLCIEFLGAPKNSDITLNFLEALYLKNKNRGDTVGYSGPRGFSNFIKKDEKYAGLMNILPITDLFQAGYRQVKAGYRPTTEASQPLFHYWGHVWFNEKINPQHL